MKRRTKSEMRATRQELAKLRLVRIMNLRITKAPIWVIKYEQIVLWFNRRGRAIDRSSADYGRLYDKYVMPQLMVTNDKAVIRALLVLMANQTSDERATEMTRHHNGEGFRPCHARMGTSMAKQINERGFLSPKQIAYWRREGKEGMRIGIYWRQLAEAAERKAKVKAYEAATKMETV